MWSALREMKSLPSWKEASVLLDQMIGAHERRTELEMHLMLLILQAQESGEMKMRKQLFPLIQHVVEVASAIAQIGGQCPPAAIKPNQTSVFNDTDSENAPK